MRLVLCGKRIGGWVEVKSATVEKPRLKLTNAEACATFLLRPAGVLLGVGPGVASTGVTGVAGTAGDAELRTEPLPLFCEFRKTGRRSKFNE
jgi:hypothetical protein